MVAFNKVPTIDEAAAAALPAAEAAAAAEAAEATAAASAQATTVAVAAEEAAEAAAAAAAPAATQAAEATSASAPALAPAQAATTVATEAAAEATAAAAAKAASEAAEIRVGFVVDILPDTSVGNNLKGGRARVVNVLPGQGSEGVCAFDVSFVINTGRITRVSQERVRYPCVEPGTEMSDALAAAGGASGAAESTTASSVRTLFILQTHIFGFC